MPRADIRLLGRRWFDRWFLMLLLLLWAESASRGAGISSGVLLVSMLRRSKQNWVDGWHMNRRRDGVQRGIWSHPPFLLLSAYLFAWPHRLPAACRAAGGMNASCRVMDHIFVGGAAVAATAALRL